MASGLDGSLKVWKVICSLKVWMGSRNRMASRGICNLKVWMGSHNRMASGGICNLKVWKVICSLKV